MNKFIFVLVLFSILSFGAGKADLSLSTTPDCRYVNGKIAAWVYDLGLDPQSAEGKLMAELISYIPHMPEISNQLTDKQKFRGDYGLTLWRRAVGFLMKIWFQGQDATHSAEAAGRTATAAFGGVGQNFAEQFGVSEGATFTNAYPYTIKGQYGSFDAPIIYMKDGKPTVKHTQFVDNHLWTMTHEGALADWNHRFTEMMIKQNPELSLMVLFGGASRDVTAGFVNTLEGGYVGTRTSKQQMKDIQVPEMKLMYAGGNNEFPVPVGKEGQDLYAEFLNREMDYQKKEDQEAAKKAMEDNLDWFMERMVFSKGGPYGNGLLHPGQIGGFDIDKRMRVNGQQTISMKGLKFGDGTEIDRHILISQLPHPTALSRLRNIAKASEKVQNALRALDKYLEDGWHVTPDPGRVNHNEAGDPYKFGNSEIGPEFYDFGAPKNRMVHQSLASRMKDRPWGIIFGTRERAKFDESSIMAARKSTPSETLDPLEVWVNTSGLPGNVGTTDRGPGAKWAKLMKEGINLKEIAKPKPGKNWEKDGIDAFNVKSHPKEVADFGHFRGTFNKPRVFVLADPRGYDDIGTSRALTGARGQHLHGIMEDVGVGENYLVLKTVPFAMDGATDAEWNNVLKNTEGYRENVIRDLFKEHKPEVVVADGPKAKAELQRILGPDAKVVVLQRGQTEDYGIIPGGQSIAKELGSTAKVTGKMRDIPRNHLPYRTRVWEGRGGDHIFTSNDKYKGQAFASVVPEYATNQKVTLPPHVQEMVNKQIKQLQDYGLRLPGESIPDFLARRAQEEQELNPKNAAGAN